MSLTAAEVAEIMRLVEQSTFDELTLEMDGVKLALRRGAAIQNGMLAAGSADAGAGGAASGAASGAAGFPAGAGSVTSGAAGHSAGASGTASGAAGHSAGTVGAASAAAGYPAMTPSAANAAGAGASAVAPPRNNEHDVPSPLLGTFYRSPKPGAPPFIEVGATVEPDTVIAIIEVMKLMNTVRAGVRGTVTDIFIADGALVEFEQPLIRVSKAG